MDIPETRLDITSIHNLQWLRRNISIRNSKHEKFKEACELITDLIKK